MPYRIFPRFFVPATVVAVFLFRARVWAANPSSAPLQPANPVVSPAQGGPNSSTAAAVNATPGTGRIRTQPAQPDLVGPPLPQGTSPRVSPGTLSENELYQRALVSKALRRNHLIVDPHPQGKRIERIVIVPYDVISTGDPWPGFLNSFHARTQPKVIRRELLFDTGDRWDTTLVEETERNLLNYLFVSMAQIVACRGSGPDRVVALVVTKDLWSLRLNTDFSYADSKLEYLRLEVVENNLGGWNRTLGAIFRQDLATNSFGLEGVEPRVAGSRIQVQATGNAIINRATGLMEGSDQTLAVGQPLYSLETDWAWTASVTHTRDIYRLFSAGEIAAVSDPVTGEFLPYEYNRDVWNATAYVTRSFGHDDKNNLSFGWEGHSWDFTTPTPATTISDSTLSYFNSTVLPYSERAGMLFVNYHFFTPDFIQLEDIDTFALTENFKLGPDFMVEIRAANPSFGFNSSFYEAQATMSYRWWTQDDMVTLSSVLATRYEKGVSPVSPWVNQLASFTAQNVSPRFAIFRLFTQGQVVRRDRDLEQDVETLGEDTILRGFPTAYLVGANLWSTNFELRTEPVEYRTVYVGAAGFVDVGNATDGPAEAAAYASTGLGLRVLFPQFNRAVVRLDAGFPLERIPGVSAFSMVAQFGQAFN